MKAEADFSWFKIFSIIGAVLAFGLGAVNFGSGGSLIYKGDTYSGVVAIISAIGWIVVAVLIYRNYHKKREEETNELKK